MENIEETLEIQDDPVLIVTEEMRSYFYDIAKWARIMGVVGFAFAGLSIFAAFAMATSVGQGSEMSTISPQFAALGKVALTIALLVMAFAIFYPSLLLYKYSVKAKFAILYFDQTVLIEAISKLKSLFQFWGIMTLIYVGMQLILLITTLSSGLATN